MLNTTSSIRTIKPSKLRRPFFPLLFQNGFTLVEMVATLIILGILAVVVIPRFNSADFDGRAFSDQTLAILRYAQKAAMAQRRTVCVLFSAPGTSPVSVTLRVTEAFNPLASSCDKDLQGPNGQAPYSIAAPSGVAFSTVLPSSYPVDFTFNPLGQASVGQAIQVRGTANVITIDQETGYVR